MFTFFNLLLKKTNFKVLRNDKYFSLVTTSKNLYFLSLHVKLSSLTSSTQLLDLFAYYTSNEPKYPSSLCYYFFNNWFNTKILLFVPFRGGQSINSVSELFYNANWLEREAGELSGVFYTMKKDTRNLMLPYGDSSFPFKKSFPSIGYRELFYNNLTNTIVSSSISIQY